MVYNLSESCVINLMGEFDVLQFCKNSVEFTSDADVRRCSKKNDQDACYANGIGPNISREISKEIETYKLEDADLKEKAQKSCEREAKL